MKILSRPHRRRSEAGVALLIAIFVLLLIGVTAIALILSSGAESALAGNYRSSASVYYAALAGIEEARGRLLQSNPDYLGALLPPPGAQLPLGNVIYIRNPNPLTAEVVNPTDLGNPATYPDTEYGTEFANTPYVTPAAQFANSVSPVAGLPGPPYKWVRINAVTEKSLNVDVNGDSNLDSTTPLYYDYACADAPGHPGPTLCLNHSPNAGQALEITALASLPNGAQNGTQKLLQYVVAPFIPPMNFSRTAGAPNPSFPSALTLVGNNVNYTGPTSTSFNVNGTDQSPVGACAPGPNAVSAIGYTNGSDSSLSNILEGIGANGSHYSGAGGAPPNVSNVVMPPNYQTPSDLDRLVQTITQGADMVINVPPGQIAEETSLPPAMLSGTPETVVVNGNFDIGNTSTGTGTLVVTGIFSYDTDSSWNGIILVIGQGVVRSNHLGNDSGRFNGAILVAKTRDSSGNLLPSLGPASFQPNNPSNGGLGIYYSTCWINAAGSRPLTYKVLSYRQLSQ